MSFSSYFFTFKPDGKTFFYFLLFHRFHKKIFYPHPERMKRKIKITAPDNPTFRIQGTEMFCRIQPGHTWQCKKHHCRYCFSCPLKKLFLILINFNQWKNFLFCTVISDVFRTVLSFLFLISRSFFADSSYMLSFSVLCSCVCSRLISPSVSSWHKQDNTLMHQSPGHIQRRTPYNF